MKPSTIIKMLRQKGSVFVEVLLTASGDPQEVEAKKADLIFMYQTYLDSDEDTGMLVERMDNGKLRLSRDYLGETLDQ